MRFLAGQFTIAAAIPCVACAVLSFSSAQAAPAAAPPFSSLSSTVEWLNTYRAERPAALAPLAIRALSLHGGFKEPEAAGVYVGFIAGLIGANPDRADALIDKMFPLHEEDQWAIVRGIAYSGHPHWKDLLRKYADRMPTRASMIAQYLDGRLPTLDRLSIKPSPTTFERMREALRVDWFDADRNKPKPAKIEPDQIILDTLWGIYLASGSCDPVLTIVAMLPWSMDKDEVDRLTVGSMAKYTLAMNASRDPNLLYLLKHLRNGKYQNKETVKVLDEVIEAAETANAGSLRKSALAAIEQLKMKGPHYKQQLSTWGKVGQGALAVGCVAAAATGHIEFGLPCVIGGGATNAVAYYTNDR